ncbi:MAG: hypothetical protein CVV49_07155 [Spirochaetae bacterium HGW-Spirochaetae-5]|nr:MAG: hypothetical protein CVV49_07155 [Spirochaetae bacterium HGW-Spirochaetae-5]
MSIVLKNESIRESTFIFTYGPGSVVELNQHLTLMILGLDFWDHEYIKDQKNIIFDERFRKTLNVDNFIKVPVPEKRNIKSNVSCLPVKIFPDWQICSNPKCGRLFRFSDVKDTLNDLREKYFAAWQNDKAIIQFEPFNRVICPFCKRGGYILNHCTSAGDISRQWDKIRMESFTPCHSFRWITICKNGHIDDIDLHAFMGGHGGELYYFINESGVNLSDLKIKYRSSSGAKDIIKSISDLMYNDPFINSVACNGTRPWLLSDNQECLCKKGNGLQFVQKGDSLVFYPSLLSSLKIPPETQSDNILVKINYIIANMLINDKDFLLIKANYIESCDKNGAFESNHYLVEAYDHVKGICKYLHKIDIPIELYDQVSNLVQYAFINLEHKIDCADDISSDYEDSLYKYRYDEYNKLNTDAVYQDQYISYHSDLYDETSSIGKFINKVVIVDKLTITHALDGLYRVTNPLFEFGTEDQSAQKQPIASKIGGKRIIPAIEMAGEGILILFNESRLNKWFKKNQSIFDKRFDNNTPMKKNLHVSDVYGWALTYLLHSFSHFFMNSLSFVCGYNVVSLREVLYCSDEFETKMMGVLITTSSSDTDSSMGGLAYYGNRKPFSELIENTIESISICSNDPVCRQQKPVEFSNNYSACFHCLVLPETCCELRNDFLDRMCLVGDGRGDELLGYFSKSLD